MEIPFPKAAISPIIIQKISIPSAYLNSLEKGTSLGFSSSSFFFFSSFSFPYLAYSTFSGTILPGLSYFFWAYYSGWLGILSVYSTFISNGYYYSG